MTRLALLSTVLLAAWGEPPAPLFPPQPYAHMPSEHAPLPRYGSPPPSQVPPGPAHGSLERCLQLQARGGLSC